MVTTKDALVSPQVISLASDCCALTSAFINSGQSGDITDATVPFWPIRRYYALWGHLGIAGLHLEIGSCGHILGSNWGLHSHIYGSRMQLHLGIIQAYLI